MSVHVGWYAVTDTVVVRDEDGGEAEFTMAEWAEFLTSVRADPSSGIRGTELRHGDTMTP